MHNVLLLLIRRLRNMLLRSILDFQISLNKRRSKILCMIWRNLVQCCTELALCIFPGASIWKWVLLDLNTLQTYGVISIFWLNNHYPCDPFNTILVFYIPCFRHFPTFWEPFSLEVQFSTNNTFAARGVYIPTIAARHNLTIDMCV